MTSGGMCHIVTQQGRRPAVPASAREAAFHVERKLRLLLAPPSRRRSPDLTHARAQSSTSPAIERANGGAWTEYGAGTGIEKREPEDWE